MNDDMDQDSIGRLCIMKTQSYCVNFLGMYLGQFVWLIVAGGYDRY